MTGTQYVQFAYAASLLLLAGYALHLWRVSRALERRDTAPRAADASAPRSARDSAS